MRVRIDREREERKIATGWFARTRIPAYCLFLTIHFSEEERYLIRHTGIGRYAFFQAPLPPDVADPNEIKKLKAADYGLFLTRDLLVFGTKPCLRSGLTSSPPTTAKQPLAPSSKNSRSSWLGRRDDGKLRRLRAVTLWENVWAEVARKRHTASHARNPGELSSARCSLPSS